MEEFSKLLEMESNGRPSRNDIDVKRNRRRSRSLGRYRSTAAVGSALSSPIEINARVEDDEEKDDDSESTANFFRMSRRKKITVILFCFSNFFIGLFYSILAPFFPTEAAKKDVSSSMVGFIFGSFELVLVLISPIFGTYMNKIGARFMFTAGMFVCGVCAILFGFLDKVDNNRNEYIVLCFVVRIFEAVGAAAFGTASFAIMAFNFPKHIATMFGTLETLTGIGLMLGPPLGGILFEFGGFILPFAVLGSFLLVIALISIFMLPIQKVTSLPHEGSIFSLLKIPIIIITGFCLIMGSGCLGFLDVTLSPFLAEEFHLTPMWVGFVFLVAPIGYAVMSPIWGRIVDSRPHLGQPFLALGYVLAGASFFFIGPAPFFGFSPNLPLVIACLVVNGLGISTLAITFLIISEATANAGYPDGLATYGLIAGIVNSFFSIGAFLGPIGGGFLQDRLGFAMTGVVIGSLTVMSALILLMYTYSSCLSAGVTKEERQSLLPPNGPQKSNDNILLTITT